MNAFILDSGLAEIATFIEGFLKSRKPDVLEEEMKRICSLRPHLSILPLLLPINTNGGDLTLEQLEFTYGNPRDWPEHLPIQNVAHARQLDRLLKAANNGKGKAADIEACDDFPTTHEGQKKCVDELVKAMMNLDDIIDKKIVDRPAARAAAAAQTATSGAGSSQQTEHMRDNYRVERVKNTPTKVFYILGWDVLVSIPFDFFQSTHQY